MASVLVLEPFATFPCITEKYAGYENKSIRSCLVSRKGLHNPFPAWRYQRRIGCIPRYGVALAALGSRPRV